MSKVYSDGTVRMPLRYFGRRLLYYPPALLTGTLFLHTNSNRQDDMEEDDDCQENAVFAYHLLTILRRRFYIDMDRQYIYDYTPYNNNTGDPIRFILCGDLPTIQELTLKERVMAVINNTNLIRTTTICQARKIHV